MFYSFLKNEIKWVISSWHTASRLYIKKYKICTRSRRVSNFSQQIHKCLTFPEYWLLLTTKSNHGTKLPLHNSWPSRPTATPVQNSKTRNPRALHKFSVVFQPPSESEVSVTSGILGRLQKWNKNDSTVSPCGTSVGPVALGQLRVSDCSGANVVIKRSDGAIMHLDRLIDSREGGCNNNDQFNGGFRV